MYVLQQNNCYPFNSHFLIGLAVVEGELGEETSERQTEKKKKKQKELGGRETSCFFCFLVIEWVLPVVITVRIMPWKVLTPRNSQ